MSLKFSKNPISTTQYIYKIQNISNRRTKAQMFLSKHTLSRLQHASTLHLLLSKMQSSVSK